MGSVGPARLQWGFGLSRHIYNAVRYLHAMGPGWGHHVRAEGLNGPIHHHTRTVNEFFKN